MDPWVRKIPWRRKWQPTPVFLPGECHGQRSLVDYSPWGHLRRVGRDWTHSHRGACPVLVYSRLWNVHWKHRWVWISPLGGWDWGPSRGSGSAVGCISAKLWLQDKLPLRSCSCSNCLKLVFPWINSFQNIRASIIKTILQEAVKDIKVRISFPPSYSLPTAPKCLSFGADNLWIPIAVTHKCLQQDG